MPPRKTPASETTPPEPSFEERLAALEAVVNDLEGEDLPLEASIRRYQEGVEHLKACRSLLDRAEARLVELVQDPRAPGGAAERPLRVGERGLEPDDESTS
jgi:exodeoxyribonuclease VII small subunit